MPVSGAVAVRVGWRLWPDAVLPDADAVGPVRDSVGEAVPALAVYGSESVGALRGADAEAVPALADTDKEAVSGALFEKVGDVVAVSTGRGVSVCESVCDFERAAAVSVAEVLLSLAVAVGATV